VITLLSVAKAFTERGQAPNVVLRPTSINLPTDQCVGILAVRRAGKTTLLQMLARNLAPDAGVIFAPSAMSPVVNSSGLFHPQLTGMENVQFIARAYGVDSNRLLETADAFWPVELSLEQPIRTQPLAARRSLEAALLTVLHFDCYLYDDVAQFEPEFFERCYDAAMQRQAAIVFTTGNPKLVRQFAEFTLVIDDATLHPFDHAEEAIEFFGQRTH
jgi:capsular polysaccharide transport system ATP-binding protein